MAITLIVVYSLTKSLHTVCMLGTKKNNFYVNSLPPYSSPPSSLKLHKRYFTIIFFLVANVQCSQCHRESQKSGLSISYDNSFLGSNNAIFQFIIIYISPSWPFFTPFSLCYTPFLFHSHKLFFQLFLPLNFYF